ncbi:hypothetical protein NA57DRAFT_60429 [Rhizodiscina lignyota]|uniref:SH3 domain-containing protein n=1 Tax=Rhizodiscina lignyota TaxID=1504668 RepID=A0A9P4I6J1_9PEZI|nr:hypothetical protein NA57DRAFT_60429 [Rhizodiscina lignyota]
MPTSAPFYGSGSKTLGTARATAAHTPRDGTELPVSRGQRFTLLSKEGEWWYIVRDGRGREGYVPAALIAVDQPDAIIALYKQWKETCDQLLERGQLSVREWDVMAIPKQVIHCNQLGCKVSRAQVNNSSARSESPLSTRFDSATSDKHHDITEPTVGICVHDLEPFLQADPEYSAEWLKRQRNSWHPDQFQKRCAPHARDTLGKIGTQMFSLMSMLVEKEAKREEELGELGLAREKRKRHQEHGTEHRATKTTVNSNSRRQDGTNEASHGATGHEGPMPTTPTQSHFNPEAPKFAFKSTNYDGSSSPVDSTPPSFNPSAASFSPAATPLNPSAQSFLPGLMSSKYAPKRFVILLKQFPSKFKLTTLCSATKPERDTKERAPPMPLRRDFTFNPAQYAPSHIRNDLPIHPPQKGSSSEAQSNTPRSHPHLASHNALNTVIERLSVQSTDDKSSFQEASTLQYAQEPSPPTTPVESPMRSFNQLRDWQEVKNIPGDWSAAKIEEVIKHFHPGRVLVERNYNADGSQTAIISTVAYLEAKKTEPTMIEASKIESLKSGLMKAGTPSRSPPPGEKIEAPKSSSKTFMASYPSFDPRSRFRKPVTRFHVPRIAPKLSSKTFNESYPSFDPGSRFRQPVARLLLTNLPSSADEKWVKALFMELSWEAECCPTRIVLLRDTGTSTDLHVVFGVLYFNDYHDASAAKALLDHRKWPMKDKIPKVEMMPMLLLPADDETDAWARRAELEPFEWEKEQFKTSGLPYVPHGDHAPRVGQRPEGVSEDRWQHLLYKAQVIKKRARNAIAERRERQMKEMESSQAVERNQAVEHGGPLLKGKAKAKEDDDMVWIERSWFWW